MLETYDYNGEFVRKTIKSPETADEFLEICKPFFDNVEKDIWHMKFVGENGFGWVAFKHNYGDYEVYELGLRVI